MWSRHPPTAQDLNKPNGEGGVVPRCRRHLPSPLRFQLGFWLGPGLQGGASCRTGGGHADLRKRFASHPGPRARSGSSLCLGQGGRGWVRAGGGRKAGLGQSDERGAGLPRNPAPERVCPRPRSTCALSPLAGCAARRPGKPGCRGRGAHTPPGPSGRLRPQPSRPHVAVSWQMHPESRWERGRGGAEAREEGG